MRAVQEQVSWRTEQVITTPERDRQHPRSEQEAFPITQIQTIWHQTKERAEESTMATELERKEKHLRKTGSSDVKCGAINVL